MATPIASPAALAERLDSLRARMRALNLDAVVVRATDRFLDEYVPTNESTRVWLSGFTGSTGDALVTLDAAHMFVDGRYDLQATRELDGARWSVEKVALGTAVEKAVADRIVQLARAKGTSGLRVGYEPDRFSLELWNKFEEWLTGVNVSLVANAPSLIEQVRGPIQESRGTVRALDEDAVGRSVAEKVKAVARWLDEQNAAAMLVQRLDEIAYLTNLRGNELPFQATFRSAALVTRSEVVLAVDGSKVSADVRPARPRIRFVGEDGIVAAVKALGAKPTIAVDASGTTLAMKSALEGAGAATIVRASPLTAMKAKKTPAELTAMRSAFQRADRVVADAQKWLIEQVLAGKRVTETEFAAQVESMFMASGAVGLSFKVISACGENAAVAHHPSDPNRVIGRGEMMLLDTGAYYEEGYATDLTRTFFVGGPGDQPTADMKKWFTLTLKSAIAGMSARIPRGATGAQLDGITRSPLWNAGLEFSHGTGHGVGINVHEFPPRVASTTSARIEEGHVFSIEPGVYLANRAGVRIENLCTVVPDPEDPNFLRVESLTFSPLDARLIEDSMLDSHERSFLTWFAKGYVA